MAVWFTSDLHFGHANIIKYCQRPFAHVDAMDAHLITTWNAHVAADDEVWVLGDVCMGDRERTLAYVGALAGTKHLVVGNHDKPFDDPRGEWAKRYRDAGFATLTHGSTMHQLGDAEVRLCHFPYRGDSRGTERYLDARPIDDGMTLLHGHTHGQWRKQRTQVDVGVDAWGGRPVADHELLALIADPASEVAPVAWPAPAR